jgi:hypothetical protein
MNVSKALLLLFGLIPSMGIAQATDSLKSSLRFEKIIHDFGKISQGPPVTCIFKFSNTGNIPLSLKDVMTSCACVTATWNRESIAPGKTDEIRITYNNAGILGHFTKATIIKFSNREYEYLIIKGFTDL